MKYNSRLVLLGLRDSGGQQQDALGFEEVHLPYVPWVPLRRGDHRVPVRPGQATVHAMAVAPRAAAGTQGLLEDHGAHSRDYQSRVHDRTLRAQQNAIASHGPELHRQDQHCHQHAQGPEDTTD